MNPTSQLYSLHFEARWSVRLLEALLGPFLALEWSSEVPQHCLPWRSLHQLKFIRGTVQAERAVSTDQNRWFCSTSLNTEFHCQVRQSKVQRLDRVLFMAMGKWECVSHLDVLIFCPFVTTESVSKKRPSPPCHASLETSLPLYKSIEITTIITGKCRRLFSVTNQGTKRSVSIECSHHGLDSLHSMAYTGVVAFGPQLLFANAKTLEEICNSQTCPWRIFCCYCSHIQFGRKAIFLSKSWRCRAFTETFEARKRRIAGFTRVGRDRQYSFT